MKMNTDIPYLDSFEKNTVVGVVDVSVMDLYLHLHRVLSNRELKQGSFFLRELGYDSLDSLIREFVPRLFDEVFLDKDSNAYTDFTDVLVNMGLSLSEIDQAVDILIGVTTPIFNQVIFDDKTKFFASISSNEKDLIPTMRISYLNTT